MRTLSTKGLFGTGDVRKVYAANYVESSDVQGPPEDDATPHSTGPIRYRMKKTVC